MGDASNPLYSYFVGYLTLYENNNHQQIIKTISEITNNYINISLIASKRTLFDEFDALLQDLININNTEQYKVNDGISINDEEDTFNNEEFMEFEIKEEDKSIIIKSQNIDKFDINFYKINIEVLFSMNPSVVIPSSQSSKSKNAIFSYIKPNQTI